MVGGAFAAAAALGAGAALVATHSRVVTDPVAAAAGSVATATGNAVSAAANATGSAVSAAAGGVAYAATVATNAVADAAEASVKATVSAGQAAASAVADTAVLAATSTAAAATAVGSGVARGVTELSSGIANEVSVKATQAGAAVMALPAKVAPPQPAEIKIGPRAGQPHGFRRAPLAPVPAAPKPKAAQPKRLPGEAPLMYPLERRPRSPLPVPARKAEAADAGGMSTLALLVSALGLSTVRRHGPDAWVTPRLSDTTRLWAARGAALLSGVFLAAQVLTLLPPLLAALLSPFSLLLSLASGGDWAGPARARRAEQPVFGVADVAQNAAVRAAKALILCAACAFFAFGVLAVLQPRNVLSKRKGKGSQPAGLRAVWPLNLL
jgi:hypothetical protein